MLSSILGMEELVVEDIMVPTSEVIGINVNDSFENAKNIIESSSYSLLPVYEDSIDGILGVLHLKDSHSFLNLLKENSNFVASWLEILRPSFNDLKEDVKEEEKIKSLEKGAILTSTKNLTTFPFVKEALDNGSLSIHGLWHNIGTGELMSYDSKSKKFIFV